jgi:hypothetical protein
MSIAARRSLIASSPLSSAWRALQVNVALYDDTADPPLPGDRRKKRRGRE